MNNILIEHGKFRFYDHNVHAPGCRRSNTNHIKTVCSAPLGLFCILLECLDFVLVVVSKRCGDRRRSSQPSTVYY